MIFQRKDKTRNVTLQELYLRKKIKLKVVYLKVLLEVEVVQLNHQVIEIDQIVQKVLFLLFLVELTQCLEESNHQVFYLKHQ